ncbi:hypothetical protein ABT144_27010 [Streptomyces sp. NPDC002039]|uniref:hypothetical protein n=1 Tax=Streptomyces sp. NPDC002039 TaxID=3154660 RepID=UPI00331DC718
MTSSPSADHPLKGVVALLGGVLLVGGVSSLLHEWFGFIRFLGFMRLLRFLVPDGLEILGGVVMVCLGCALLAVSRLLGGRGRR